MADAEFTVLVELRVVGPDAEWEAVAEKVTRRLEGMRLRGGYVVRQAAADTSDETEAG